MSWLFGPSESTTKLIDFSKRCLTEAIDDKTKDEEYELLKLYTDSEVFLFVDQDGVDVGKAFREHMLSSVQQYMLQLSESNLRAVAENCDAYRVEVENKKRLEEEKCAMRKNAVVKGKIDLFRNHEFRKEPRPTIVHARSIVVPESFRKKIEEIYSKRGLK